MRKKFRPVDFHTSNMGNNYITLECMMSAPFHEHSPELFAKCLAEVPKINRLLIDRRKCENKEHYEKVLMVADMCLSMMMIERRLGIVNEDNSYFNQK
ncbi:hypothetical protein R3G25_004537 [Salmonella enterica]|uniref:hypothetical protein n=1 Tax=Enterobacteriaceae TaxID=543 RepID=UPI001272738B|nr:hypothetical protein [Enterobacter hormaechei]EBS4637000.1 hypothetical protein [Salmonella enterica subsp. enterica serovar Bareilly]ECZ6664492.1 hypothetical protein [Salmonella enterica]EKR8134830.1 hypothetical protein [Escherichia coli]ELA5070470.1 hypothetical protein [Salmonella enterica subsp. enterica serovar Newport]MDT7287770.1 hypothetical protein [Citrobacter freundii]HDS4660427.1 hypothetical protein [Klebsiella pneumoniae subsp. pneumoniae]